MEGEDMYISEFVCGIFATLIAEAVLCIVAAILLSRKK